MNKVQRETTVGFVCDNLEAMAQELASSLSDLAPAQREFRWSHIQNILAQRDAVAQAVKTALLFEMEGALKSDSQGETS